MRSAYPHANVALEEAAKVLKYFTVYSNLP